MNGQMYDDAKLQRLARAWMTDDVTGTASDAHLDQVLSATGQVRPAPRWLALLKEPPMRVQTQTRLVAGTSARRPILILVGLGLLILALAAGIVGAQLLQQRTDVPGDWPGFRGDGTHAGVGLDGPVGRPVLEWRFQAGAPIYGPVAIVGELAFAASDDGVLHAINLADGTERWSSPVVSAGGTGPVVVDGVAYVVDKDGRPHAVAAADGRELWSGASFAAGPRDPVVAGGSLYVGSYGGQVVAFDTATGAERWRARVGGLEVGNPATDGSGVYVPTEGAFVALEAATGAERWRIDVGSDAPDAAVVDGGIAYVGGGSSTTEGHLRAVDTATGAVRWTIDEPFFAPTVADGVAYANSIPGDLAAISSETGTIRWRTLVGPAPRAPALANGIVYQAVDSQRLILAFDATTGGELWRYDVAASNACCIAVAKGSVFVALVDGSLLRIGGDGTAVSAAPLLAP